MLGCGPISPLVFVFLFATRLACLSDLARTTERIVCCNIIITMVYVSLAEYKCVASVNNESYTYYVRQIGSSYECVEAVSTDRAILQRTKELGKHYIVKCPSALFMGGVRLPASVSCPVSEVSIRVFLMKCSFPRLFLTTPVSQRCISMRVIHQYITLLQES